MNPELRNMIFNADSLRELALDILELYEESEKSVICSTCFDINAGLANLDIEINEFKNEINGFK